MLSITKDKLAEQLIKQLSNFFIVSDEEVIIIYDVFEEVLLRTFNCFECCDNKYYRKNGTVYFNVVHSNQYLIFLYFFANTVYKRQLNNTGLSDKLYYLNKIMNCIDLFFEVEMPDYFECEHPVGSVIGRAKIGNGFKIYQNCVVGGYHNKNGTISYPQLGLNVHMYAGSMIIGKCIIGDNVSVGAGTIVKNFDIPKNSIVFGIYPNLTIKSK